jgi:hypothetical protein
VIVAVLLVPLTGVSVMLPEPLALTPLNVPDTLEVHVYVVPVTVEVGIKFKAVPLQISWINAVEVLVITGVAPTLTVTPIVLPLQPPALGVIV